MTKTRALKDAATDPLAKKEAAASKNEDPGHGIGHYVLTISIGLIAGVVGGLLSSRILKIL
jgi:hypothetical protein